MREMRRKRQQLSKEACEQVLLQGTNGVLAVAGDDGYPYAVPLSYVYADGKIFFHCAKSGHKLDAILREDKVCFCVVDQDKIIPEEYTTYFRSVIAFGRAHVLEDEAKKMAAMDVLAAKYRPGHEQSRKEEIEKQWKALCLVELCIEHMTGKEAVELVKEKH